MPSERLTDLLPAPLQTLCPAGPFCGVGNSLRLTLNVHSPRPGGDYPVLLNATDGVHSMRLGAYYVHLPHRMHPRPQLTHDMLAAAAAVEASLDNVTEASTGTPAFAADEDSTSAVYTYAEETVVPTRRLMAQGNGGASASSGKPTGEQQHAAGSAGHGPPSGDRSHGAPGAWLAAGWRSCAAACCVGRGSTALHLLKRRQPR